MENVQVPSELLKSVKDVSVMYQKNKDEVKIKKSEINRVAEKVFEALIGMKELPNNAIVNLALDYVKIQIWEDRKRKGHELFG